MCILAPRGILSNLLTHVNGITAAKHSLSSGAPESRQGVLAMRAILTYLCPGTSPNSQENSHIFPASSTRNWRTHKSKLCPQKVAVRHQHLQMTSFVCVQRQRTQLSGLDPRTLLSWAKLCIICATAQKISMQSHGCSGAEHLTGSICCYLPANSGCNCTDTNPLQDKCQRHYTKPHQRTCQDPSVLTNPKLTSPSLAPEEEMV